MYSFVVNPGDRVYLFSVAALWQIIKTPHLIPTGREFGNFSIGH